MEHEPRPERVSEDIERKAVETSACTKSGLVPLKRCVCRKNIKEEEYQNEDFPSPLKMIPVRRGVGSNTLALGRFTEGL